MYNATAQHLLTNTQPASGQQSRSRENPEIAIPQALSFSVPTDLQTEHDIVGHGIFHWPVLGHCSGYALSQLLVHLNASKT